jgi:hypothetical protein
MLIDTSIGKTQLIIHATGIMRMHMPDSQALDAPPRDRRFREIEEPAQRSSRLSDAVAYQTRDAMEISTGMADQS